MWNNPYDRARVNFIWETKKPRDELIMNTENECFELLEKGLRNPGSLYFHTVIDKKNPVIAVFGKSKFPNTFFCKYHPQAKWIKDVTTMTKTQQDGTTHVRVHFKK